MQTGFDLFNVEPGMKIFVEEKSENTVMAKTPNWYIK